jgi:hypothetical protein
MSTFKKITDQQKALQETISKDGKQALAEEFKKFFNLFPQVKTIKWDQFTPHFNDGDSCVFGVNDFWIFTGTEDEDGYEGSGSLSWYNVDDILKNNYKSQSEVLVDTLKSLSKSDKKWYVDFVKGIHENNDLFEAVFGDHATVIASINGFTVEECSHD